MNRRKFLGLSAASLSLSRLPDTYASMKESLRQKVKITSVKALVVRGPIADWPLVKIETDAGITGYGECYWGRVRR